MKRSTTLVLSAFFSSVLVANTFTVTNTNDNGAGSLRWAIEESNV